MGPLTLSVMVQDSAISSSSSSGNTFYHNLQFCMSGLESWKDMANWVTGIINARVITASWG